MPTLASDLADILGTIRQPGDYFVSGRVELPAPGLEVEGVGPVALPLLGFQAEQLVKAAEPAPYGRGEETLVDPAVRRCWQIGAERVRFSGRHWRRTLDEIVARVGDGLGLTGPVAAEFYKLLIYDRGGFFVGHRDTEKAPGMFATLVIVLPSLHEGGELIIRHRGREARLSLRPDDASEAGFAAFYADCVHEVLPVTEGCRLTLIYNLIREGRGRPPEPPDYQREQAAATALLGAWGRDGHRPDKLVWPLEHAYTPAELGFATLKGADAGVAGVLAEAARASDCDLHLALLTIEEDGAAEYVDGGYGRRGRWSEPELKASEVDNRSETLSDWVRLDGAPSPLGPIPVEEGEISPPDAFDDLPPDEEEFHEATGNEGASFERSYRRGALVLWPRARFFAVLTQAGPKVTLPCLADFAARWEASGEGRDTTLWRDADTLAGQIVGKWPTEPWTSWGDKDASDASLLLAALTRLGNEGRIRDLLDKITLSAGFAKGDAPAIAASLALLPPVLAAEALERLIGAAIAAAPASCAALLAHAAADTRAPDWLVTPAERLVMMLPVQSGRSPGPGFLVDVLRALCRIEPILAERAAGHVLAHPGAYDADTVLIPALLQLTAQPPQPAVERLRAAALAHLQARIAEPLAPPADWRREARLPCSCEDCRELARFLADPAHKSWTLRAVQHRRSHVETTILNAKPDLTCTTERKGSPHTLICTKNQASFERRVEQRREDIANLTRLGEGWCTPN